MKTRQYIQLDRPVVDNLLTTGDAYVIVPFNIDRTEETRNYWDAWHLTGVKVLLFSATTKDLKVKILGSLDGITFSQTVEAEFTVTTSATVLKRITAYWPYLQIQVKPASAGQNGTLSVQAMGTTFSSEVDTELTATIDPTGLATETTLAKLTQKVQLHANIDFSSASAQTIIAAPGAGNRIRLTRLSLSSGSNPQVNVEIALKSGATTIETVKGSAMAFDYPEHRNLGTNEAFIIQCTTADRVIGGGDYYVEAV